MRLEKEWLFFWSPTFAQLFSFFSFYIGLIWSRSRVAFPANFFLCEMLSGNISLHTVTRKVNRRSSFQSRMYNVARNYRSCTLFHPCELHQCELKQAENEFRPDPKCVPPSLAPPPQLRFLGLAFPRADGRRCANACPFLSATFFGVPCRASFWEPARPLWGFGSFCA